MQAILADKLGAGQSEWNPSLPLRLKGFSKIVLVSPSSSWRHHFSCLEQHLPCRAY